MNTQHEQEQKSFDFKKTNVYHKIFKSLCMWTFRKSQHLPLSTFYFPNLEKVKKKKKKTISPAEWFVLSGRISPPFAALLHLQNHSRCFVTHAAERQTRSELFQTNIAGLVWFYVYSMCGSHFFLSSIFFIFRVQSGKACCATLGFYEQEIIRHESHWI